MNEEKDLQELLAEKVEGEFHTWVESISRKCVECEASDFLAEYAYEYVCKQDIVSVVECSDFSDEACKKLLMKEYPLDFLFEEWMDCDATVTDALIDCIRDALEKL